MGTVFTQHAVERMRERDVSNCDANRLIEKVERVSANLDTLTGSGDVIRLGLRRGDETFIVRAGDMRAVVAVNATRPEQIIVLGVYRAEETQPHPDPMRPRAVEAG